MTAIGSRAVTQWNDICTRDAHLKSSIVDGDSGQVIGPEVVDQVTAHGLKVPDTCRVVLNKNLETTHHVNLNASQVVDGSG